MSRKVTDVDKILALPWLVAASSANQLFWFLIVASSVVTLFFNELGLDKSRIGLILSIIPFCQIVGIFAGNMIARIGFKRGFLVFYSLRKAVISLILFSPLILSRYGENVTFYWIATIFIIFAILRALGETAFLPWSKELIPDSIRGKFNAINSIAGTIATIIVFFAAGYVIDNFQGLSRFVYMMVFGLVLGVFSIFCFAVLPGGRPDELTESQRPGLKEIYQVLRDKNYMIFLAGAGFASFAFGSMFSFVPLYLKDAIGIAPGVIVWVDIASMTGTAILVFFWGWAADRYGSKPIMLISLTLALILPIGWIFMPRNNPASIYFAFIISFIAGSAFIGWVVSFMSLYLIKVAVPEEKKSTYLPVFYSFIGLVGGLGPLLGGWLLEVSGSLSIQFKYIHFDSFTLLFLTGLVSLVIGIRFISTLRPDGEVSAQEFVGMIFQTNPATTFGNMIRYRWAGDETDRITTAERMGSSKAMLSSNELMEALEDPSFNVRHEAINAIGKLQPNPRLVDALLLILGGDQPDLSLSAAWALGKLGDKSAIVPLREMLLSEYELLQARSARALGMLGDTESIDFMLSKLCSEPDKGLRVAYASALSLLKVEEALNDIMDLLSEVDDQTNRQELSLAIARIIGSENIYIRLQRRFKRDLATTAAQIVLSLKKTAGFSPKSNQYENTLVRNCASELASGNINNGIKLLCELVRIVPFENQNPSILVVVEKTIQQLEKFSSQRPEYLLLLLYALILKN